MASKETAIVVGMAELGCEIGLLSILTVQPAAAMTERSFALSLSIHTKSKKGVSVKDFR